MSPERFFPEAHRAIARGDFVVIRKTSAMGTSESQCVRAPTGAELRTAWLRTEDGVAIMCAWCDDLKLAEARAQAAGLTLTHGICKQCAKEKLGIDITGESFAPVVPFVRGGTEGLL